MHYNNVQQAQMGGKYSIHTMAKLVVHSKIDIDKPEINTWKLGGGYYWIECTQSQSLFGILHELDKDLWVFHSSEQVNLIMKLIFALYQKGHSNFQFIFLISRRAFPKLRFPILHFQNESYNCIYSIESIYI